MREYKKSDALLDQIDKINHACFTGVEVPPFQALEFNYRSGDIFVDYDTTSEQGSPDLGPMPHHAVAYAIVTGNEIGHPFIWSLAVRPEWQKQGRATRLLKEIIATYGPGADSIELACNVNNPAQKLYFDQGFRTFVVLRGYYGDESGLRMRRVL